ncbi:Aminoacyl-tRNA hydrolase [Aphelenchoides besseyi]|nr:Aminoacyl-tRNA hydrolase [Aphelenchoides besseyi]
MGIFNSTPQNADSSSSSSSSSSNSSTSSLTLRKTMRTHKMIFVANMGLKMGAGKLAAQGQAGLKNWERLGETKVVVKGQTAEHLGELYNQAKSLENDLPSPSPTFVESNYAVHFQNTSAFGKATDPFKVIENFIGGNITTAYRVLENGASTILRIFAPRFDIDVAVKLMDKTQMSAQQANTFLYREMEISLMLRHQFI